MSKLVYVTGAGRGIGRTMAVTLARQGYVVTGCARTLKELEETKKLSDGKIRVAQVDVTDEQAVAQWLKREAHESGASPWSLVTAAGIYGALGPFLENSWEEWKQGVDVNLYGTLYAVREFAKNLLAQKKPGRIVLLSGGGATQPIPGFSSYCASKAAVVRFGETLAHELRDNGITVNSIAPGGIRTKFTDDIIAAGPEKIGRVMYEKALKQKEAGGDDPQKAANLVTMLMSEEASHITGRLISAIWDPWQKFLTDPKLLEKPETYTLRRVTP